MIDQTDQECVRLIGEIRRVVQRLALISHAPSQAFNPAPPPDDQARPQRNRLSDSRPPVPHLGSHRQFSADSSIPSGDIDRKGDLTPEFRQKSHIYFTRKMARWERVERVYGPRLLGELRDEALETLEAWQKTPMMAGVEPTRADPQWKRWVADSSLSASEIARKHNVTARYVREIRAGYRDAA